MLQADSPHQADIHKRAKRCSQMRLYELPREANGWDFQTRVPSHTEGTVHEFFSRLFDDDLKRSHTWKSLIRLKAKLHHESEAEYWAFPWGCNSWGCGLIPCKIWSQAQWQGWRDRSWHRWLPTRSNIMILHKAVEQAPSPFPNREADLGGLET